MNLEKIYDKYSKDDDLAKKARKLEAFAMIEAGRKRPKEVANQLALKPATVSGWKKEAWWLEASEQYHTDRIRETQKDIVNYVGKALPKIFENIEIANPDKQLGAMVQLVNKFMEVGDKPLIDKKAGDVNVSVDNRTLNVGLDMKKIENAPDDVLVAIAQGNIPPEYRKDVE